MMIHIASTIHAFTQGAQEDGTDAGVGLSAIQTFTYFLVAPVALFLVISVLAYVATGDRKKSAKSDSVITSID
ncbi:hypothetical protein MCEGKSH29_01010 [Candidatus Nanopelagicaceae bacterium]